MFQYCFFFLDLSSFVSLELLTGQRLILTSASVVVLSQVVTMATGAVVPSNEVVTELGAFVACVIVTLIKI